MVVSRLFIKNLSFLSQTPKFVSTIGFRRICTSPKLFENLLSEEMSGKDRATLVRDLRRKTGAGISLCMEALNTSRSISEAEKYVEKMLAEKAIAIESTVSDVNNGLVGLATDLQNTTAFVTKLECKTDFVAKTKEFQDALRLITAAGLANYKNEFDYMPNQKIIMEYDQIKDFKISKDSNSDTIENTIQKLSSQVGEKLVLNQCISICVYPECFLGVYVHYPENNEITTDDYRFLFGRIGAFCVVSKNALTPALEENVQSKYFKLANDAAVHIVGMLPTSIGIYKEDLGVFFSGGKQLKEFYSEHNRSDVLLDQQFFLNPNYSVRQWCNSNFVRIDDFTLFE